MKPPTNRSIPAGPNLSDKERFEALRENCLNAHKQPCNCGVGHFLRSVPLRFRDSFCNCDISQNQGRVHLSSLNLTQIGFYCGSCRKLYRLAGRPKPCEVCYSLCIPTYPFSPVLCRRHDVPTSRRSGRIKGLSFH